MATNENRSIAIVDFDGLFTIQIKLQQFQRIANYRCNLSRTRETQFKQSNNKQTHRFDDGIVC